MKIFRVFLVIIMTFLFAICIGAKETVIYENDFSNGYLDELTLNGNWVVNNDRLALGSGSGSGWIFFDIPEEYSGCRYKIEVDFIGHTSTGGILIGALGDSLSAAPVQFHGYDCFLGNNGKKAALGSYKADGSWSGNFQVSGDVVTAADIHLSVEVCGDELKYNVTSLDGKTSYFGMFYKIGTASKDVYNAFSNRVGLRKFYADKGSFDNLKITVFTDDKIPTLNKKIDFGGFEFKTNALKLSNGAVAGNGAMLTTTSLAENFKASVMLTPDAETKILFGMKDNQNGYAFGIDKNNEQIAFYQIKDGKYIRKGVKNMPVYDGEHLVIVDVTDGVATVTYDAFFEGEDAFKSFDFRLNDYTAGKFGVILNGGRMKDFTVSETDSITGETYINPVAWGPDPDVLYYDGTYYLYNRISAGNDIFRVYTSPDLARWTARNVVFVNDPSEHNVQHYMSPNVCYYDGTFYLFYAAKNTSGSNRLYCATSDSPYGPFTHKHGQVPLHEVPEIGGHPYIDPDTGKFYLTYARFGGGNHIWIEELILADDKATPVPGTLTKLVSPTEDYEIDGHGFISEGGVITKHNGLYYMIWATGHYEGHYGEAYGVAENILGPYTKYEYNDILAWNSDIDGTGDGVFVKSPDGKELWMVYHKHFAVGTVSPRYTCIDKVKFVKDPNGGADILTVNGPSTTPQPKVSNIYRYDVDRDGATRLYDALLAIKEPGELYSGKYDADCNNRNDENDAMAIIAEIVK
ncbi:MAG: hypothetical protein E7598_02860 [Ruminococcaceae bacterium]|nr:hypothetical protein [Oscillospiraceae bacterium]